MGTKKSVSLLVSMGISTFTSKEIVIFCRVSGRLAMFICIQCLTLFRDLNSSRHLSGVGV